MKSLFTIFLQLIYLSSAVTAQQPVLNSYSLKQSLEIALANNLQVKQSEFQARSAGIALKQEKSNLLPDIFASINHGLSQGRSIDPATNGYVNDNVSYANYALSGGITLFSGLVLRNQIKRSAYVYQASAMEEQQAKDNLALKVVIAYFQILNNEDQVSQARLQKEITISQIERLQILDKKGAIAPAQLSDLMGQLANDELSLINSQNNLNSSKITLAELMNVAYTRDFKVERIPSDEFSEKSLDAPEDIYILALEQLATIKGTTLRTKSAAQSVKIAKGLNSPQLRLNSDLLSNYSSAATPDLSLPEQLRSNYSSSYNLSLRIPILTSDRTRNRLALAKIELESAKRVEETTKLQLKQVVDLAWFNKTTADERLRILNEQLIAFKASFQSAQIRLNAGVGTVVDYMIAKNNLDRTSINLINARYDWLLRVKILDYYKGQLVYH